MIIVYALQDPSDFAWMSVPIAKGYDSVKCRIRQIREHRILFMRFDLVRFPKTHCLIHVVGRGTSQNRLVVRLALVLSESVAFVEGRLLFCYCSICCEAH